MEFVGLMSNEGSTLVDEFLHSVRPVRDDIYRFLFKKNEQNKF